MSHTEVLGLSHHDPLMHQELGDASFHYMWGLMWFRDHTAANKVTKKGQNCHIKESKRFQYGTTWWEGYNTTIEESTGMDVNWGTSRSLEWKLQQYCLDPERSSPWPGMASRQDQYKAARDCYRLWLHDMSWSCINYKVSQNNDALWNNPWMKANGNVED